MHTVPVRRHLDWRAFGLMVTLCAI